jgi:hypothetical protein
VLLAPKSTLTKVALALSVLAAGAIAALMLWVPGGAPQVGQGLSSTCWYPIRNEEGKWGCMDRSRTLVVDFAYDDEAIAELWDKYRIGWRGGVCVLSTIDGEVLAKAALGIFPVGPEVVALSERDSCVIMSLDGPREVARFSNAWPSHDDGPVGVKNRDGKWGFLDEKGRLQIPFRYDAVGGFSEGRCAVALGELRGYIDTGGAWVVKGHFTKAGAFCEGYAAVAKGGRQWYIDRDGKNPFGRTYRIGTSFSEGLAATMDESGKFGYIDTTGNYAISPQFKYAAGFSEGLAYVGISTGGDTVRHGYIDRTGQLVIEWKGPPRGFRRREPRPAQRSRGIGTELGPFQGGWARVQFPGGSGYIDIKGKWVWIDGDPRWLRRLKKRQKPRKRG